MDPDSWAGIGLQARTERVSNIRRIIPISHGDRVEGMARRYRLCETHTYHSMKPVSSKEMGFRCNEEQRMGVMPRRLTPRNPLFNRRHFADDVIIIVCPLVSAFQAQL